jgi:hypothetical protein
MISKTLSTIVDIINNYMAPDDVNPPLGLADISQINDGGEVAQCAAYKLLLSVVHVEENDVVNSPETLKRENHAPRCDYSTLRQLEVTVLFSATNEYANALRLLEKVIRFFQIKNVFLPFNTPELEMLNKAGNAHVGKVTFDRVNLNLDQLQQLWNALGGDYRPSLVFKMRMAIVREQDVAARGPFLRNMMGHMNWSKYAIV